MGLTIAGTEDKYRCGFFYGSLMMQDFHQPTQHQTVTIVGGKGVT